MANGLFSVEIPRFLAGDPRELLFLRYGEGRGTVRGDGKGLSIVLQMFTLDGSPDGGQLLSGEVTAESLDDLVTPPRRQPVRFGEPGPIHEVPVTCRCKATWTFEDGSTLNAIGKGTSHIVPLKATAISFSSGPGITRMGVMADASTMVVTEGTGRFAGVRGTVQVNSSTFLPDLDNGVFGKPGADVNQKSIHLFRIYLADTIAG